MIRPGGVLLLAWFAAAPLSAQEVTAGNLVLLRGLDRLSGATTDLEVPVGGDVQYERLRITVEACRYPSANPSADAFGFLQIDDVRNDQQLFRGWMIASAPALSALDDARFDVWVLACRTGTPSVASETGRPETGSEAAGTETNGTGTETGTGAPDTDAAVEDALAEVDPATLAPVRSIRPRPRP